MDNEFDIENFETFELIDELKSRDELNDGILDEFNSDDLVDELNSRGNLDEIIIKYSEYIEDDIIINEFIKRNMLNKIIDNTSKDNFKRLLCDVFDVNYHTSEINLISMIINKLNENKFYLE